MKASFRGMFVLIALFLLFACKDRRAREDKRILVGRITVSSIEIGEDGSAVRDFAMEKVLVSKLEKAIADDGRIVTGSERMDPLELAVVVSGHEPGPDGAEPAAGRLAVCTLRTTHGDGYRISSSIATSIGDEAPGIPADLILDLVDGLLAQLVLFEETDEVLAEIAGDEEASADTRATAIRILGERESTGAVPTLVSTLELTGSDDPLFEDLVGALSRIGDERASPSLVKAFGRAETWQAVIIVEALGSTGGEEARQFLVVVASGHDSPVVKERAKHALTSMDKR